MGGWSRSPRLVRLPTVPTIGSACGKLKSLFPTETIGHRRRQTLSVGTWRSGAGRPHHAGTATEHAER